MKENNIYCKTRKKYKATTNSKHNYPVAPNLLKQNFEAKAIYNCFMLIRIIE